jgi:hypothetical protein
MVLEKILKAKEIREPGIVWIISLDVEIANKERTSSQEWDNDSNVDIFNK